MASASVPECVPALENALSGAVNSVIQKGPHSHRLPVLDVAQHVRVHEQERAEVAAAALCSDVIAGGMFTLGIGRASDMKMLEDILGPPDTLEPGAAMEREHTVSADSDVEFIPQNYKTRTTSRIEYLFVTCPEQGLGRLGLSEWPGEDPEILPLGDPRRRKPRSTEEVEKRRKELNRRLAQMDAPEVTRDDAVAGILYTGPLGLKYQRMLRACAVGHQPEQKWRLEFLREWCRENRYPTTVSLVHSAVHKLSRLTEPGLLFCGISDGVLPQWMREPDASGVRPSPPPLLVSSSSSTCTSTPATSPSPSICHSTCVCSAVACTGVRSGLEFGFTSTTPDVKVALEYAKPEGALGTLLEIRTGAFDRGADLSRLSQYPHEKEVLLPPLTLHDVEWLHVARDAPWLLVVRSRVRVPEPALKPPLLTDAQLTALSSAVTAACHRPASSEPAGKFDGDAKALITGNPSEAARGLAHYMQVSDAALRDGMGRGLGAIEDEARALGNAELSECVAYVLHEAP